MKTFYFTAGLPRSGSTLLQNILAQNPRFYPTSTSGVVEILRGIKDGWGRVSPFNAMNDQESQKMLLGCLSGALNGCFAHVDKPVVFDKNRAWPRYIGTLSKILDNDVKILACVRDPREILASLELRWRETDSVGFAPHPPKIDMSTIEARLKYFALQGPMGQPFRFLKEAVYQGHKDKILFVEFDDLTGDPELTMSRIYRFLGEESFDHNFDNVEQVTHEDDRFHGYVGLHTIRSKVEPVESKWRDVLGDFAKPYAQQEFWKTIV